MKFALNIEYGNYNSKDRVLVFEGEINYFTNGSDLSLCKFHINALVETTKDFDINSDEIQFVGDSCSVQIRPKGIHKNSIGYFYKLKSTRVYLKPNEVDEMNAFIDRCVSQKDELLQRKRR